MLLENINKKGIEFLEKKSDISYIDKQDEDTITEALSGKDAVN